MARGKKGSGKKANGGTRDLTGRNPNKKTAAEIKAAADAMSVSDREEKIREHLGAIDRLEEERRSINADIKDRREKLAAIGVTKIGSDWARKRLAEDAEIREANIQSAKDTFAAFGLGKDSKIDARQSDMFGGARTAEPKDANDYAEAAHAAGYRAAAEGQFRTENPHAPDTGEHAAWNDGWDRHTREHAESMAPRQPEAVH